ncbi:hypothetical protein CMI47_20255 [Candidatus Pacearchaeota archaeon]|nr:hypothetical protein [Candidatus Pacearchaeota archaeon]
MEVLSRKVSLEDFGKGLAQALACAKKEALKSECTYKHGAALFKKNRIYSSGHNKGRSVGWVRPCRKRPFLEANMHAEIACIHFVPKEIVSGRDVIVVRINTYGFANSRPCSMCLSVLKRKNIRRCYYSINNEYFGELNFSQP